ncbi:hypothetical protein HK097_009754 [Rhizophlyctis rosea]|uniref:Uncharacterized protein n=1 Tax=Rhizophlyctis rosea TaxID=64517 RepID=A0AAD5X0V8_9FUNG|nr:hypothetical protein HK097_009754 [Rhizophlyctis rosea]
MEQLPPELSTLIANDGGEETVERRSEGPAPPRCYLSHTLIPQPILRTALGHINSTLDKTYKLFDRQIYRIDGPSTIVKNALDRHAKITLLAPGAGRSMRLAADGFGFIHLAQQKKISTVTSNKNSAQPTETKAKRKKPIADPQVQRKRLNPAKIKLIRQYQRTAKMRMKE